MEAGGATHLTHWWVSVLLESAVEEVLQIEARRYGAMSFKIVPTTAGLPDRIILWPGGRTTWVELKADRGAVRGVQRVMHNRIRSRGHEVVVLYGASEVRRWFSEQRTEA